MWFVCDEVEQETSAPLLQKILDPPLQPISSCTIKICVRDKVYQQFVTDQSEIKVPSSITSYEIEVFLVPCPFRLRSLTYLWLSFLRRGRRNFLRWEECKERFSMNFLFASNFIYSFQIFALTLFLVIQTEFA